MSDRKSNQESRDDRINWSESRRDDDFDKNEGETKRREEEREREENSESLRQKEIDERQREQDREEIRQMMKPMRSPGQEKKEKELFFTDWNLETKKIIQKSDMSKYLENAGIKYDTERKISPEIDRRYERLQKEFVKIIKTMRSTGILVVDIETPDKYNNDKILEIGVVYWDKETGNIKKVFNSLTKPVNFSEIKDDSWIFKNSDLSKTDFDNLSNTDWTKLKGLDPITRKEDYLRNILVRYPITGFSIKSFDIPALKKVNLVTSENNILFDLGEVSKLIMGRKQKSSEESAYKYLFNDVEYEESHRSYIDAYDEAKILNELYIKGQDKENFLKYQKLEEERVKTEELESRAQGENLTYNYAKGILSYLYKIPEDEIFIEKGKYYEWLRDPEGKFDKLQLDLYWKEQKIAFEYNGMQHYRYIKMYCPEGEIDLITRQKRDQVKRDLCNKNGVTLIEIPYFVPIDEMQDWIFFNLKMDANQRNQMYEKTRKIQNYEIFQQDLKTLFNESKIINEEYNSMSRMDWAKFPSNCKSEEEKLNQMLGSKRRLISHYLGNKKPIMVECDFCKERGESQYIYKTTPQNILRSYMDKNCYRFYKSGLNNYPELVKQLTGNQEQDEKIMADWAKDVIIPKIEEDHPEIIESKVISLKILREKFNQFYYICLHNNISRVNVFHRFGYNFEISTNHEYPRLTENKEENEKLMADFVKTIIIPSIVKIYPEIKENHNISPFHLIKEFPFFSKLCSKYGLDRKEIFQKNGYIFQRIEAVQYPTFTDNAQDNERLMANFAKENLIPRIIEEHPEVLETRIITPSMLHFSQYLRLRDRYQLDQKRIFKQIGYKIKDNPSYKRKSHQE